MLGMELIKETVGEHGESEGTVRLYADDGVGMGLFLVRVFRRRRRRHPPDATERSAGSTPTVHLEEAYARYDAALTAAAEPVRPPTKVMDGGVHRTRAGARWRPDRILRADGLTTP
jgi:hypothetical protein